MHFDILRLLSQSHGESTDIDAQHRQPEVDLHEEIDQDADQGQLTELADRWNVSDESDHHDDQFHH